MPKAKKTKSKKRRPSDCKNTKSGDCKGKYKLQYEDSAPTFICNKCGDVESTWKKFYTEYLQLYREKDNWDVEKHKITCIIGFFCHMYKEFYSTEYVFVPQNPNPYGCKECKDAWKLLATFKGNAHAVRKYIYWVFKKLINKNTTITSFGYINTPGIIRKYNLYVQKKTTITRSTDLPREFTDWCKENTPSIFDDYELSTINDLGALLSYTKFYEVDYLSAEAKAIQMAEKLNLIKNGKLNTKE
jgi:hypothetical protein